MNQKQINRIIKCLEQNDVSFDKGLSNNEIFQVENTFEIKFPDDLKLLLKTKLPTSNGFVNWRYGINSQTGKNEIENKLNWPKKGLLFDIRNNLFWMNDWGKKPENFKEQKEIVENVLSKQPKLIPIYSHRYISSEPLEMGNPVFSVYQMDIIHYGFDLADYLANEFGFKLPKLFGTVSEPKRIEFWSDMIDLNNEIIK